MRRLLIADDSSTIRRVVVHAFAGTDIDVIAVDSGRAAVDAARRERPDLVLCDVLMPEMSGYEVLESLKAEPRTATVPVLLLTGAYEPFDEERASRAGAIGFLAKPFETRLLIQRVEEVLAGRGGQTREQGESGGQVAVEVVSAGPKGTHTGDDPLGTLSDIPQSWPAAATRVPLPGDDDFQLAPPAAVPAASAVAVPSAAFDEAWRAEVQRVIETIAPDIVREVAWEVVPDLLERLLREAVPPPPAANAKGSGERS